VFFFVLLDRINLQRFGSDRCSAGEFECVGEGRCLSAEWICDGDRDCAGGQDEANCSNVTCPEWKFACAKGGCVLKSWECDGDQVSDQ
jgi:hypothetical protein